MNNSFNYQFLARLQQDCDYFLGCGNRNAKHLWALDIDNHIAEMHKIFEKLDPKPDWITLEDIENYSREMNSDTPTQSKC